MDIGNRLRVAREQRGLTVGDIARATKIPPRMLDAIERNDTAHLPHPFFTRAYLRAYATEVGVEPADVLEPYAEHIQNEPSEAMDHYDLEPTEIEGERHAGHGWVVIVLGIAAAYGIYGVSPRTATDAFTNYAPSNLATPTTEPYRASAPVADVAPLRDMMQVQIQSSGSCMVSAAADGEPVISRMVPAGENATIQGRGEIVLHVADAGGCVYTLSSTSGRRLHPSGETVIRLVEESADMLVARNTRRAQSMTPSPQIRHVGTLDTTGTAGVLHKTPEVAGLPIDASITSVLPVEPVPPAPAVGETISIAADSAANADR